MYLLPFDSFALTSEDSCDRLAERLHQHVEPQGWFQCRHTSKPFQGSVTERGFRVSRTIYYRNSFQPVVFGAFKPQPSGTLIVVSMAPHPVVMVFMAAWISSLAPTFLLSLVALLLSQEPTWQISAVLLGMLVFGWVLTLFGFWMEAPKTRAMLLEILTAS